MCLCLRSCVEAEVGFDKRGTRRISSFRHLGVDVMFAGGDLDPGGMVCPSFGESGTRHIHTQAQASF